MVQLSWFVVVCGGLVMVVHGGSIVMVHGGLIIECQK